MACRVLSGIVGVEKVWSLPGGGGGHAILSSGLANPSEWRALPSRALNRVVLRDRWGKHVVGHPLPGFEVLKLPPAPAASDLKVEHLDASLGLVRCRRGEGGVTCQLSDGSELIGTGVIFADGARSRGRELMERLSRQRVDPDGVACWSYVRPDLLDLQAWELRTALGKSVEQLPLPEGKVRVKLRFRTPYGAKQDAGELLSLFSDFGPDMESLLEGVDGQSITYWEEEEPAGVVFCPLPGTIALGEAALGVPLLSSFDWSMRLCKRQMERVVESLLADSWDPEAFEPAFQDTLRPLLASERFFRRALHYDNALLRPLRDLALKLVPSGILVERLKNRLGI